MRPAPLLRPLLVLTALGAFATVAPAGERPAADALIGTWTVDLRPTPASPAYLKNLVITSVEGGRLEGSFYSENPLQAGRWNNTASEVLCFAFSTNPGEGDYFTSGRLVAPDRLEGMTLSTTRGFLLPWSATRAAAVTGARP